MGGGAIGNASRPASFVAHLINGTARMAFQRQPPVLPAAAPAVESNLTAPFLSAVKGRTDASSGVAISQSPALNLDDQELGGGKGVDQFHWQNSSPRQIFGPAPTLDEAEEATSDLKEALKMVCYSPSPTPNTSECRQMPHSGERSAVATAPKCAVQMYNMLQQSSQIQPVVASLASDENVWNAMMKNEKVMEFCRNISPSKFSESVVEEEFLSKDSSINPGTEIQPEEGSMFAGIVNSCNAWVSKMVNNINDFLGDFLAALPVNSGSKAAASPAEALRTEAHCIDMAWGGTIFALAVAVIMLILFKRP